MLHSVASELACGLIQRCRFTEQKRDVLTYGFEICLSTALGILSILVLAALGKTILDGFLFLIIFFSLRLFTGGFHASTYFRCFLLSNAVYLFAELLAYILLWGSPLFSISVLLVSSLAILVKAPVMNARHPVSKETYNKDKVVARLLALFEPYIIISLYFHHFNHHFLSICSASMFAVVLLMMLPKIIQTRRDQNEKVL